MLTRVEPEQNTHKCQVALWASPSQWLCWILLGQLDTKVRVIGEKKASTK